MLQKSNSLTTPASQASRNPEAMDIDHHVDKAAHWVLNIGELVDILSTLLLMFDVLHPTSQFEMAHHSLGIACTLLRLCIKWHSHAPKHENGANRLPKQVSENPDKLKS